MLYYSESTGGFYDTAFAKYTLPPDSVEISKDQYKALSIETMKGSLIKLEGGIFKTTRPELTVEQQITAEYQWIDVELDRAGAELDKVQDGDSGSVGTVSAWRTYRKELRGWKDNENFPQKNFRPVSPDS